MKSDRKVFCVFFFCIGTWIACPAWGQHQKNKPGTTVIVEDTLSVGHGGLIGASKPGVETAPDTVIIEKADKKHIPRKAALFSAAFPGLGQIYNGKYWKLPIIYGGFATLGYFAVLKNDQYQLFRRAKIAIQNNAQEENPLRNVKGGDRLERLNSIVESTRRDRDFTIILIAGLYGLQIMDAIVDAHLIEFDVNESLTLQLHPSVDSNAFYPKASHYGLALTLHIK